MLWEELTQHHVEQQAAGDERRQREEQPRRLSPECPPPINPQAGRGYPEDPEEDPRGELYGRRAEAVKLVCDFQEQRDDVQKGVKRAAREDVPEVTAESCREAGGAPPA